jgi:hypothetical protein
VDKVAIAFGGLFFLLGIVGFVMTGSQHPTALIPAALGAVLEALGVATMLRPDLRKHLMHVAAVVGLLGFLGTIGGLIAGIRWLAGTTPENPAAVASKSAMCILSLIFVLLCVNSFIQARRNRQAAPAAPPANP